MPEDTNFSFRKEIVYAIAQRVGDISHLNKIPWPNRAVAGIGFTRLSRNAAHCVVKSAGKEQRTGLISGTMSRRYGDPDREVPVIVEAIIQAPSKQEGQVICTFQRCRLVDLEAISRDDAQASFAKEGHTVAQRQARLRNDARDVIHPQGM